MRGVNAAQLDEFPLSRRGRPVADQGKRLLV